MAVAAVNLCIVLSRTTSALCYCQVWLFGSVLPFLASFQFVFWRFLLTWFSRRQLMKHFKKAVKLRDWCLLLFLLINWLVYGKKFYLALFRVAHVASYWQFAKWARLNALFVEVSQECSAGIPGFMSKIWGVLESYNQGWKIPLRLSIPIFSLALLLFCHCCLINLF